MPPKRGNMQCRPRCRAMGFPIADRHCHFATETNLLELCEHSFCLIFAKLLILAWCVARLTNPWCDCRQVQRETTNRSGRSHPLVPRATRKTGVHSCAKTKEATCQTQINSEEDTCDLTECGPHFGVSGPAPATRSSNRSQRRRWKRGRGCGFVQRCSRRQRPRTARDLSIVRIKSIQ